jgi:hypothetical protein
LKESDADRKLSSEQRAERDRLDTELASLRRRKGELTKDAYFTELERILVGLAKISTNAGGEKPTIGK